MRPNWCACELMPCRRWRRPWSELGLPHVQTPKRVCSTTSVRARSSYLVQLQSEASGACVTPYPATGMHNGTPHGALRGPLLRRAHPSPSRNRLPCTVHSVHPYFVPSADRSCPWINPAVPVPLAPTPPQCMALEPAHAQVLPRSVQSKPPSASAHTRPLPWLRPRRRARPARRASL